MTIRDAEARVSALYHAARRKPATDAILALSEFVTGRDCVVLLDGHGLRAIKCAARPGHECHLIAQPEPDQSLQSLGLELVKSQLTNEETNPDNRTTEIGALVLRAGLLDKMLDLSLAHLAPRTSNGQPTLHQQLVKASFAQCHAQSQHVVLEAPFFLENGGQLALGDVHAALSYATAQAAKLMGGHGFLMGSLNTIETLSLVVAGLFGGGRPSRMSA